MNIRKKVALSFASYFIAFLVNLVVLTMTMTTEPSREAILTIGLMGALEGFLFTNVVILSGYKFPMFVPWGQLVLYVLWTVAIAVGGYVTALAVVGLI